MKKKTYEFSSIGYAQFCHDIKVRKQKKISTTTSLLVLGGLLAFGVLSKEIVVIYGVNTAIGIITDWLL